MKTIEILTAALVNLSLSAATPFSASALPLASASTPTSAGVASVSHASSYIADATSSATPSAQAQAILCPAGDSAPVTSSSRIYRYHEVSPDGIHAACGYYWLDIHPDGTYDFGGNVTNFSPSRTYWLGLGTVFQDSGDWAYKHKYKCSMEPGKWCTMTGSGQSPDIKQRWQWIWNGGMGYDSADAYKVDPTEGNVNPDPLVDGAVDELPDPSVEEVELV